MMVAEADPIAEAVADVAIAAVDGDVTRTGAVLDHGAKDLRRLLETDHHDRIGGGAHDFGHFGVERAGVGLVDLHDADGDASRLQQ